MMFEVLFWTHYVTRILHYALHYAVKCVKNAPGLMSIIIYDRIMLGLSISTRIIFFFHTFLVFLLSLVKSINEIGSLIISYLLFYLKFEITFNYKLHQSTSNMSLCLTNSFYKPNLFFYNLNCRATANLVF